MNSKHLKFLYSLSLATLLSLDSKAAVAVIDSQPRADTFNQASILTLQKSSSDAVLLDNGDVLYGSLLTIDPKETIRWHHPDAQDPIEFIASDVVGIQFGEFTPPQHGPTNACRIRLTNQDEFEGNLVFCDAEKLVLKTWYAGEITFPRKMVQYVAPKPMMGPPVFQGPEGIEGWTLGKVAATVPNSGQWSYRNGAFYATQSASIARDVNLPDVASVQFDVAWKGMLYLAIALYTDYLQPVSLQTKETEPDFGGFYSLQLNSYVVNLLAITKQDPIRYLGQHPIPSLSQKDKVQVEIRASKSQRIIALLVDGVVVKQWTDPEGFIGKGTGMRIVHQGQGAVRISNIKVMRWDGQFEEKPVNPPDSKHDLAQLQNGDKVAGEMQQIRDGTVAFQVSASGTPLDIPLERVKMLEMAGRKSDRAPEDGEDARAWLRSGGTVTFQLKKWDEKGVIGTSPNFGTVTFNPKAFDRILLNSKLFAGATPTTPPMTR